MDRSVSGGSQRSEAAARSGSQPNGELGCWCCCAIFVALVVTVMLVFAFGVAEPVHATVTDASLGSLDVVVTTNGTDTSLASLDVAVTTNGTDTAASSSISIAYNLSLTVQLRNENWAMRVELAAPLEAELRFADRRIDGARLADPGTSIRPGGAKEFPVLAASSPAGVLLRRAGAVAEIARERAEAVFVVELRITGEVRYRPVHAGRSRLEVTCPLKLLMPNAPRGAHNMVVLRTA